VVRRAGEKAARTANAAATPQNPATDQRRGRPTGRQHHQKADGTLPPELGRIKRLITALRHRLAASLSWTSLVRDGHFGHHHALPMARHGHGHRLATRRSDAAWSWPSTGLYAGRGPHRTSGSQLACHRIPQPYLKATTVAGPRQTGSSQAPRRHKEFAPALKVVIIVTMTLPTPARAPVILFRSDRDLPSDLWRDDDGLRFQLEFNFRDAKQSWGLADGMHVTETAVTTAAHRALFMVNVSPRLRRDLRQRDPASSILDLKAQGCGYTYVPETITMLPENPAPDVLTQIFTTVACFGRIHVVQPSFSPG